MRSGEGSSVGDRQEHQSALWRWAKLLRVHQYSKNALIFVPLLAAHRFDWESLAAAGVAALAFSLCASSAYILNDILDLADDRRHPTKRHRPITSGAVPLRHGLVAIPVLLLAAIAIASAVSLTFVVVLLGYFVLTLAYSMVLKRKMLVDVVTLAGLYSIRIVAGAVAVQVAPSKWLLAFCMAIFMSLALIKRYVELATLIQANLPDPVNRNYRAGDLQIVGALAAAAGFNAVTIFALYVSGDTVFGLYSRPEVLWLVCPLLTYWIGRALMLAHRGEMDADPVVFALRDPVSLAVLVMVAVLGLIAL